MHSVPSLGWELCYYKFEFIRFFSTIMMGFKILGCNEGIDIKRRDIKI